jgi:SAM-dependent methyltransferase
VEPVKRLQLFLFNRYLEALRVKKNESPDTVSAGYGEITKAGFHKVLTYLQEEVDDNLKLTKDSSFIDIGSGFGKTVFHTKIVANVHTSDGVEYVGSRYTKSMELFQKFSTSIPLSGVNFAQGDATQYKKFDYSHIYCYDYIFNETTHAALLPIIEKSKFKLFVCFSKPAKLAKFGVTKFELLYKFPVTTTGKQSFTVYFYKKM